MDRPTPHCCAYHWDNRPVMFRPATELEREGVYWNRLVRTSLRRAMQVGKASASDLLISPHAFMTQGEVSYGMILSMSH